MSVWHCHARVVQPLEPSLYRQISLPSLAPTPPCPSFFLTPAGCLAEMCTCSMAKDAQALTD